jgi:hypothetical protein
MGKVVKTFPDGRVLFWCPGCDGAHGVAVGEGKGPRWGYNEDEEKPTFSPSILVTWGGLNKKCHSFVKDGQIQFLTDCTHNLAGQTVDLPEWDAH